MPANIENTQASRRPPDTALRQQRMKGYKPILDPLWVIVAMFVFGVLFLPLGFYILKKSDEIVELALEYDSYKNSSESLPCGIGREANSNKTCILPSFVAPKDMQPPILVYYQLTNFYQNHFKYKESRDENQLLGAPLSEQQRSARQNCEPLNKLGNLTIYPCGLFANTFFNDIIELVDANDIETGEPLEMQEDGIAWKSELKYRFRQPDDFRFEQCASCDDCSCEGEEWSCASPWKDPSDDSCYRYFYPDDDTIQYLHETYPMVINPIEGVTNEHFIVWMRTATLPKFRKLYGYINQPISKGTEISFKVTANFEVTSFSGTKTLVLSTANEFGGKNYFLGQSLLIVGAISIFFAILFGLKHWLAPRKLGDRMYLKYKFQ